MMNYIRTKDNIYKISKTLKNGNLLIKGKFHIDKNLANYFKQADTIEELCDEFVVINNNCFNTPILVGIRIDKEYYKNEIVYGAIWTDKGLIYVAKMNSEGVLELL